MWGGVVTTQSVGAPHLLLSYLSSTVLIVKRTVVPLFKDTTHYRLHVKAPRAAVILSKQF